MFELGFVFVFVFEYELLPFAYTNYHKQLE